MTVPADQRVAQLVGVQRFRQTPASYYTAGALADFNYTDPFSLFFLVSAVSVVDQGGTFALLRGGNSAAEGIHIIYQTGIFRFIVGTGGSIVADVTYNPPPGQILACTMSCDGATLRARLSDIGSASAGAAAVVASDNAMTLGVRPVAHDQGATPFAAYALLGTGSVAHSDADMLTTINELVDNAEQGRDLAAGLSVFVPEDYLDLADAWQGPGAPLKATLAARIGGSTFTKTGEPEAAGFAARF